MTVNELIEELQKLPKDLPVFVEWHEANKLIDEVLPNGKRLVRICDYWKAN